MNRLRRFILWGLSLAVLASVAASSLPRVISPASISSAQFDDAASSLEIAAATLPGFAIRSDLDSSGPILLERLRAEWAWLEMPGCEAGIEPLSYLSRSLCGTRITQSLMTLKTRWQL
ncbi:hypothetical protein [Bremerella sp.]|uniref:hypothetical protein n=1 Tax=Bremerella sp. TaxID=2795602 RepID=UPI00391D4F9B